MSDEEENYEIGLVLSGGGFRAMLFHLGSLWRLNELGILPRLGKIASVSGGSIVNARLGAVWHRLKFERGVATNFVSEVADPVTAFADTWVDIPSFLIGTLPFISPGNVAARFYRRLVSSSTLQDLPDSPVFEFVATHLNTAQRWPIQKKWMGNFRMGIMPNPQIPLALAVAASAAFPPFLSPVKLRLGRRQLEATAGSDLNWVDPLTRSIALSDGGIYDNIALESIQRRYRKLLISDASGGLLVKEGSFAWWPSQILRVIDTQGAQLAPMRLRMLPYWVGEAPDRAYAYWSTFSSPDRFGSKQIFPVQEGWQHRLGGVKTTLRPLGRTAIQRTVLKSQLVNWGYLLADLAVRSSIEPQATISQMLPYPDFGFEKPPVRHPALAGLPEPGL